MLENMFDQKIQIGSQVAANKTVISYMFDKILDEIKDS